MSDNLNGCCGAALRYSSWPHGSSVISLDGFADGSWVALPSLGGSDALPMTQRKMSLGPKLLLIWWIIVLVFGLLGNLSIAVTAFNSGNSAPGLVFGALGVGCAVMLYRTYIYRNDVRH